MPRKKIRVGLFLGGCSPEHEVSLKSAFNLIRHFDSTLFEVSLIYISISGEWFRLNAARLSPKPLSAFPFYHSKKRFLDVIFPIILGMTGEDGILQGFLELSGYPYVGSRVLSSAVGMDKHVAKVLVQSEGISVAPWILVKRTEWEKNKVKLLQRVQQKIRPPLFVKAVNSGSSLGVYLVKKTADLARALQSAFKYDERLIIEPAIDAREISFGVLETNGKRVLSLAGEVCFTSEFLSSEIKKHADRSVRFEIPAILSPSQLNRAKTIALKVFDLLQCEIMARVDLFLDRKSGDLIFNEINTIPGFTEESLYPMLFEASGLSTKRLLTHLIKASLLRHRNQMLKQAPIE